MLVKQGLLCSLGLQGQREIQPLGHPAVRTPLRVRFPIHGSQDYSRDTQAQNPGHGLAVPQQEVAVSAVFQQQGLAVFLGQRAMVIGQIHGGSLGNPVIHPQVRAGSLEGTGRRGLRQLVEARGPLAGGGEARRVCGTQAVLQDSGNEKGGVVK